MTFPSTNLNNLHIIILRYMELASMEGEFQKNSHGWYIYQIIFYLFTMAMGEKMIAKKTGIHFLVCQSIITKQDNFRDAHNEPSIYKWYYDFKSRGCNNQLAIHQKLKQL